MQKSSNFLPSQGNACCSVKRGRKVQSLMGTFWCETINHRTPLFCKLRTKCTSIKTFEQNRLLQVVAMNIFCPVWFLKIIQIIATSDVHLTQSVSRTTPETSEVLQVKRWSGITKTHKQWIFVGKIMLGVILTSQIGVNEWSSDARGAWAFSCRTLITGTSCSCKFTDLCYTRNYLSPFVTPEAEGRCFGNLEPNSR